jgi:nucleoside-diphosphate-sugar epimerase
VIRSNSIIDPEDVILVTGAGGFIGRRLIAALQRRGFKRIRCLVRSSKTRLDCGTSDPAVVELFSGDLLSRTDCENATRDVSVIYHLAAGTGTKSFADAFLNSVVTTRNLVEGALRHGCLRRFVNVSSFAVYKNEGRPRTGVLDESCPTEERPELRGDAYCFAKVKQDQLVCEYGKKHRLPYVLVRPGVVYGPGKCRIHGRVGLDTFGVFLHLGGSNTIPFTYVDNCAEAVALAGLVPGIEGEVFNIVDDDLPSSRQFLRMYKKNVRRFRSIFVPHLVSYLLCGMWEKYAAWSHGQLPPVHNRKEWAAYWKSTAYSNEKLKKMLQWTPRVRTPEGLNRFFESCREEVVHA